ncbi:hypothetical protein BKA00_000440 [Actinomadura coerulea]|uniref:Uncharacterized protein n=1 Tax=Actinomadura coerulea TaxID=46159 RepID=A0A7X0KWQ1_9ACTN|nr:hypothetical protein [Actinomadura coerulea]MBB6393526.1 hypothetical protein [Actinomadura coerulea]GGP92261.1 hypothetical protein GCM10010187_04620 [Actinomadura coerulea]
MEVGKWIVFAFLTGVVIVGFKTRSLKGWEFAASGAFVLLLDQLVFKGQISSWLGNLGSNVRGAAGNASAGMLLFTPGAWPRARRFGARMWKHRPGPADLAMYAAAGVLMHVWLGAPWLVVALTITGLPIAFTAISAATAPQPRTNTHTPAARTEQEEAGDVPVCPVCGDAATTWETGHDIGHDGDPDGELADQQAEPGGVDRWRCAQGHRFALTPGGHVRGLTVRE